MRFFVLFFLLPFQLLAKSYLDVSFFGGTVWGRGQEYVRADGSNPVNPDFVVSELDWPIEALFVLGGTFNFNYLDHRLHLTFEGWNKAASKKVKMIDEDFLTADPAVLTNISIHPKTHFTSAYQVSVEGCFDVFDFRPLKVGSLAGFQYSKFEWQSFGGTYLYFVGGSPPFINGTFDNTLVIEYRQYFSVPYLGLIFKWETPRLKAALFGKLSPFAYVEGIDYHALRGLFFIDRFRNKTYYILGAKAGVLLCDRLTFDLKYTYEEMKKSIGETTLIDSMGASTIFGGAYIAHNHSTFEMALTAHF